jgi:hypothetical protein
MLKIKYVEATSILYDPLQEDPENRNPASAREIASIPMVPYIEDKDYSLYYGISFIVLVLFIVFFSYKYFKKKY